MGAYYFRFQKFLSGHSERQLSYRNSTLKRYPLKLWTAVILSLWENPDWDYSEIENKKVLKEFLTSIYCRYVGLGYIFFWYTYSWLLNHFLKACTAASFSQKETRVNINIIFQVAYAQHQGVFEVWSVFNMLKAKKAENGNAGNIKSNRYCAFVTKVTLNYEVFHYQSCACSKVTVIRQLGEFSVFLNRQKLLANEPWILNSRVVDLCLFLNHSLKLVKAFCYDDL